MIPRSLILATILCVAGACGTDAPDPQGTYHVAISATTEQSLPSAVSWPVASDLTLVIDAAGFTKVTFLDSPALVTLQDNNPDGSLHLEMYTSFPGQVLDPEACPRASVFSNKYGATFFLDFQGEHVEGTTVSFVDCFLATGPVSAMFSFELTGDRVHR